MKGLITTLCFAIVSMFDASLCLFVPMFDTYVLEFDAYVHCVCA
jgi:hypothetical protein